MNFFDKFNKLKVKYKDNKSIRISLLLGIISILFIFVGGSYAFIFKSAYTSSVNTISAGNLVITLENTTPVISVNGAVPTPDEIGLQSNMSYDFTLKNTGSINAKYKLSLINNCVVGNTYTVDGASTKADVCIPINYIKAGISRNNNDFEVAKETEDGNIILDSDVLSSSKSNSYSLKLWLDYDTPNEYNLKDKNVVMSVKIQLYSEQTTEYGSDTSGANKPELTSNMIPVYYDDKNDVWRKADVINKKGNWYNYNEKKWANAVTVSNTLSSKYKEKVQKNVSFNLNSSLEFTGGGPVIIDDKAYEYVYLKLTYKTDDMAYGIYSLQDSNGTNIRTELQLDNMVSLLSYDDYAWEKDYDFSTGKKEGYLSDLYKNDNKKLSDYIQKHSYAILIFDIFGSDKAFFVDLSDENNYVMHAIGQFYMPMYYFADSYIFNESTGLYTLTNKSYMSVTTDVVGKYYCADDNDSCHTMYKINSISDNSVTSADKYSREELHDMTKLVLMDGTTKNCDSSICTRSDLLNADVGTEIPMPSINTMWVWIPRYTYTYFSPDKPQEIKIKFEKGTNSTGTIKCTNAIGKVDKNGNSISEICTDNENGSLVVGKSAYTHPAFTFGDQELTGIWVGKFENSATVTPTETSTEDSTIIIKPNVQSLNFKLVSYMFKDARQMEASNNIYGFSQGNSTTFNWDGTLTGDSNNIDTHMMKNMEWGATLYLSHSKYGINKEIAFNSAVNTYITGCGPQSVGSREQGLICNTYNTTLGQSASTTGNVYGVYDMNGGSIEYVMGNMVDYSNNFYPSSSGNWSSSLKPLAKYYDSYAYGTTSYDSSAYARGKLGDATKELASFNTQYYDIWYSPSDSSFPYDYGSWFLRSGSAGGEFAFSYNNGGDDSSSSRSVLSVLSQ